MASVEQYNLPAVVAGAAQTVDIGIVEGHGGEGFAVGEVRLVQHTAQAAQGATNFVVLGLQYTRAGAAPVVIGTLSLGANAVVVDIPLAFVLAAQEAAVLQSGDVLQFTATHTGTGGALTAGSILEIERD